MELPTFEEYSDMVEVVQKADDAAKPILTRQVKIGPTGKVQEGSLGPVPGEFRHRPFQRLDFPLTEFEAWEKLNVSGYLKLGTKLQVEARWNVFEKHGMSNFFKVLKEKMGAYCNQNFELNFGLEKFNEYALGLISSWAHQYDQKELFESAKKLAAMELESPVVDNVEDKIFSAMDNFEDLDYDISNALYSLNWSRSTQLLKEIFSSGKKDHIKKGIHVEYMNGITTVEVPSKQDREDYVIVSGGTHSAIITGRKVLIGRSQMIDYLVTTLESYLAFRMYSKYEPLNWLLPFEREFSKLWKKGTYSDISAYMKSFETLCLTLADHSDDRDNNTIALAASLSSFEGLLRMERKDIYRAYYEEDPGDNPGLQILSLAKAVDPEDLCSLSSIHKIFGVAEGSYYRGLTKFTNRTNPMYPCKKLSAERLRNAFVSGFTLGYYSRHKKFPRYKDRTTGEEFDQVPAIAEEMINFHKQGDNPAVDRTRISKKWSNISLSNTYGKCIPSSTEVFVKQKSCSKEDVDFTSLSNTLNGVSILKEEGPQEIPLITDIIKDLKEKIRPYEEIKKKIIELRFPSGDVEFFDEHERFTILTSENEKLNTLAKFIYSGEPPKWGIPWVKLAPKEKEQKTEFRFFGIATYIHKMSLSHYSECCKKAISCMSGQIMTQTFTDRAKMIHSMAQKTNKEGNYSIMADITGHNQSMNIDNTAEISREIMNLYGIEDGDIVPSYYKYMLCYAQVRNTSDSYLSVGQSSGIEGWFNPLWGIVTSLSLELFMIDNNQNPRDVMAYSDDCECLVEVKDRSHSEHLLRILKEQLKDIGLMVKMSQTALSKCRVTMLRVHSIYGSLCSTSLKRATSMSIFTSQHVKLIHLESESVSSSYSSALEFSEEMIPLSIHKWLYLLILGVYDFAKCISAGVLKSVEVKNGLIDILLTPKLHTAIIEVNSIQESLKRNIISEYLQEGTAYVDLWGTTYSINLHTGEMNSKGIISNFNDLPNDKKKEVLIAIFENYCGQDWKKGLTPIFYDMSKKDDLLMLFLIWCISPVKLGGLGVSHFLNASVSGHSTSASKTLSVIMMTVGMRYNDNVLARVHEHFARYYKIREDEQISERDVLRLYSNSEFPVHRGLRNTVQGMFKDMQVRELTTGKVHDHILRLRESLVLKEDNSIEIAKIFKEGFYYRMVNKYVECLPGHEFETFMRKIEAAQDILKPTYDKSNYRKICTYARRCCKVMGDVLFSSTGSERFKLFRQPEKTLLDIVTNDLAKHGVTVLQFVEPTYYSILKKTNTRNNQINCMVLSKYGVKEDHSYIRGAALHNSVKPRYPPRFTESNNFQSYQEFQTFDCLRYTRWIVNVEKKIRKLNSIPIKKVDQWNAVVACDAVLRAHGSPTTYLEVEKYLLAPDRGLGPHRTDNPQFKDLSNVRIMPNDSGRLVTTFHPDFIEKYGGVDNNFNLDYLRSIVISMSLVGVKLAMYKERDIISLCFITKLVQNTSFVDCEVPLCRNASYKGNMANVYAVKSSPEFLEKYNALVTTPSQDSVPNISHILGIDELEGLGRNYNSVYTIKARLAFNLSELIRDGKIRSVNQLSDEMLEYLLTEEERKILRVTDNKSLRKLCTHQMESTKMRIVFNNDIDRAISQSIEQRTEFAYDAFKRTKSHVKESNLKHFRSALVARVMALKLLSFVWKCKERDRVVVRLNLDRMWSRLYTCKWMIRGGTLPFSEELYNEIVDEIDFTSIKIRERTEQLLKSWIEKEPYHQVFMAVNRRPPPELSIPLDNVEEDWEAAYTFAPASRESIMATKNISKLISFYATMCNHYGDLSSLDSKTGSGARQSALGVLKLLSRHDLIPQAVDLTAGRGDFHKAMHDLCIDHVSYSRGDPFDTCRRYEGITYDTSLDIFKFDTYKNYLITNAMTIIDISFTKGDYDTENIYSTVLDVLSMSSSLLLRMNHINHDASELLYDSIQDAGIKYSWVVPSNSETGCTPNYIYMLFVKDSSRGKIPDQESGLERDMIFSDLERLLKHRDRDDYTHSKCKEGLTLPLSSFLDDTVIKERALAMASANISSEKELAELMYSFGIDNQLTSLAGYARKDKEGNDYISLNAITLRKDLKFMELIVGDAFKLHYRQMTTEGESKKVPKCLNRAMDTWTDKEIMEIHESLVKGKFSSYSPDLVLEENRTITGFWKSLGINLFAYKVNEEEIMRDLVMTSQDKNKITTVQLAHNMGIYESELISTSVLKETALTQLDRLMSLYMKSNVSRDELRTLIDLCIYCVTSGSTVYSGYAYLYSIGEKINSSSKKMTKLIAKYKQVAYSFEQCLTNNTRALLVTLMDDIKMPEMGNMRSLAKHSMRTAQYKRTDVMNPNSLDKQSYGSGLLAKIVENFNMDFLQDKRTFYSMSGSPAGKDIVKDYEQGLGSTQAFGSGIGEAIGEVLSTVQLSEEVLEMMMEIGDDYYEDED